MRLRMGVLALGLLGPGLALAQSVSEPVPVREVPAPDSGGRLSVVPQTATGPGSSGNNRFVLRPPTWQQRERPLARRLLGAPPATPPSRGSSTLDENRAAQFDNDHWLVPPTYQLGIDSTRGK